MNESILGNKTLYKIFLYCAKISPYVYAIVQILGTFCYYFNIVTNIPSFIGGCSLLTVILLLLISRVFNFCLMHRIPIYYIMTVFLIALVNNLLSLGNIIILLRVNILIIGIFLLVYIYIWYKYRNIPKIDNILYFCKNYCNC